MVRYLRNTLMAQLGGEQTELLQISGDERARAARTALLFTEEELTRNLQIVLRMFDDLNYRQEQRFHLELGLLKLIHAQRLLPIEELLSGAASGGVRSSTPPSAPRASTAHSSAGPPRPAPTAAPAAAPHSPFGPGSGGWSSGPALKQSTPAAPVAEMERAAPASTATATAEAPSVQFSASAPIAASSASYGATASLTEGALARAPEAALPASGAPSMEAIRHAIGSALVDGGHTSAAQLLGAGTWTLDGASLRIDVSMGKKMLGLTVNAAAEKIIRQEMQRLGAPTRFMVVPGGNVGGGTQAAAAMAAPLAGSIQEAALAHPLVERARELFKAEVRSVIDLRAK
jgi:DNA polymerase-3 subunit gamma/tau